MTGTDQTGTSTGAGPVRTVTVATARPYPVHIGRGATQLLAPAVADLGAARAVVVHQPALAATARRVCADLDRQGVAATTHELPDAEDGKTVAAASACWDTCARHGLTRRDVVVGVGGGAATDVAGFVAATWMRGVPVVQYPTTLLAMVDAAVGGKTGINTAAGKNLVGAFHEPSAVIADIDVLDTLPRRELVAGSAEIIKAGFIADPAILALYEADPAAALDPDGTLPELVERAVRVKASVVASDLHEAGLREILNYGHTYGHAVEHHEQYRWRHGDAVAVGMVFEAELARAAGLLSAGAVDRHRRILRSVGLPVSYDGADLATLTTAMGRDKKNRGAAIRFVVLRDTPGGGTEPTRLDGPDPDLLAAAYAATAGATPVPGGDAPTSREGHGEDE
ncbi:3-dehydroquinate synthase [Corynebacterium bovis]|uniref:3-dehydroquinate synthase n=1 Tax=Corynebacterium bovis TaxID=36808 RepID=UPI002448657C|nr:3-dehydroquinate synthase [Corynebacterium bovis]MDH2455030.1 3-dehydroquinate synthase [Corynebacterium bovis]